MPGVPDPEQAGMTEDEHLQRHHVLPGMPVAVVGERFIRKRHAQSRMKLLAS